MLTNAWQWFSYKTFTRPTLLLEIATGIQNKFSKMYRPQGKLFYFPLDRKCNLEVKAKKYVTERS